jgi:hypothetical protein
MRTIRNQGLGQIKDRLQMSYPMVCKIREERHPGAAMLKPFLVFRQCSDHGRMQKRLRPLF